MKKPKLAFIPGDLAACAGYPLARYIPPFMAGSAVGWLETRARPGDWVLDPLGSTPALPIELAQHGYRVLVVSNNPVLTFMLETLASAPPESTFQSVLAELASVRRGDERLVVHLQSLYETDCAVCGQKIQAQAFLWRHEESQPYARIYNCPHCHDEGERPITPKDLERLAMVGTGSLHRSRAIERVSLPGDLHRAGVEEALTAYLPRSLYVIFTLLNKIEGLAISEERRRLLYALLLSILDEGNVLWPWPVTRSRPRQMSIPPQFRENNLWLSFEQAVAAWRQIEQPVQVTRWPQLPTEKSGICIFPGRLRNLIPLPENLHLSASLAIFPRPNQAFWSLSAIWTGWLWGREAILPLKSALERKRYDWHWHAAALHNSLDNLHRLSGSDLPFFGQLTELEPGFIAAVLTAGQAAGFSLQGLALRGEQQSAQCLWLPASTPPEQLLENSDIEEDCRQAIHDVLIRRNEPTSYLQLYAAALGVNRFPVPEQSLSGDSFSILQTLITRIFNDRTFIYRNSGTSQNIESGWWWLAGHSPGPISLVDRVESEIVKLLIRNPGLSSQEIDRTLCQIFPGPLTPSPVFVSACLDSYAVEIPGQPGHWQIKPQDTPSARRTDLQQAVKQLQSIGQSMGFHWSGENPYSWFDQNDQLVHQFVLLASSNISRFLFSQQIPLPFHSIFVLPGGRSQLLVWKLRNNPLLAEKAEGYHFLKFRSLRQIAEAGAITPAALEQQLDSDPPRWEDAVQIAMFSD